MFKVIIADDESRVCRLIQMLVDWDALGMEVIGTASNGLEALEMVKTLMPDILITDIRMPGCNGLELIERAKSISPRLEIALVSGYAQFEYAQIAMRHDVGGYLLKPIKKEALTDLLKKLGKKCGERAYSEQIIERLHIDSDKSRHLLQNRLPEDLLHKRLVNPTREYLRSEYSFPVQDGLLQVIILKIDCDTEYYKSPAIAIIKKKAEEMFETAISPICLLSVFQFCGAAGYGVLNYEPEKGGQIRRALRQLLNQMEAQKPIFGNVEFSLAIGKADENPEELPVSMQEAQNAIAERLLEGTGRLFESITTPSNTNFRKLLDKYAREIEHAVSAMSAQQADKAAEELENDAVLLTGIRGYELLDLLLAAGKIFAMRINIEEDAELIREFEERCGLCGSTARLFNCLRDFQTRQIESVSRRRENEAIRPIRIAQEYIRNHFSEPITLEDVCEATGFSSSYFSTMFKKETGEGFSKYLTRVRIEQAKLLLQDTSLSIAVICEKVGYNDLKHFTGTFKKMTNLNPGQYRKLYG